MWFILRCILEFCYLLLIYFLIVRGYIVIVFFIWFVLIYGIIEIRVSSVLKICYILDWIGWIRVISYNENIFSRWNVLIVILIYVL